MNTSKAIRYLLFVFFTVAQAVPSAIAKEIGEIYQESKGSIVLIVAYDRHKIPLSLGTGFYFRRKAILTNYHVVENGHAFLIKFIGSDSTFEASRVSHFSKALDLAILPVETEASPLPIRQEQTPQIGDKVIAIGNPKGLEGSVSSGIVSGVRPVDNFSILQITAPISPGSSGGPVFDMEGHVIGIATFTVVDSQNLNFAIPAGLALKLEKMKSAWEPKTPVEIKPRQGTAGIELALYRKEKTSPTEAFSFRNTTQHAVKNLKGIFVYKDTNGRVINFRYVSFADTIPPGLAKMNKEWVPRGIGQDMAYYKNKDVFIKSKDELYDVELRVLSYDIVEERRPDVFDIIRR